MDVIELPSYTRTEKFNIAKRHLLPKQLKNNGLEGRATLTNSALYAIIDGYTREAGVRNLERTITSVLRKCAQKIAAGEEEKISVSAAMVKTLLGPEKIKPTFISRKDAVGIANGLAWTSVGGEMLPVEVAIIPNGSGKIEITGSLGDVMKESAQLAVTYAKVHAEEYGIAADKFKKTDLHIHAPEGAVPKDGLGGRHADDGADFGAVRHPGAPRPCHDRRDHAARQRPAHRRPEGKEHGRLPRGHFDGAHPER